MAGHGGAGGMTAKGGFDAKGRWRDARGRFAPLPSPGPATVRRRWRLTLFDRPHGRWHDDRGAAMAEAIARGLASWDASRREHYLAVPAGLQCEEQW